MVVSDLFLKCAAEEGLQIREYTPPAGGGVECTVTAEDDLLVGRLAADFSGAKQVDLCFFDEHGNERLRFPDIPVHPGTNHVAFQESVRFAKSAPSYKTIARLVAVDEAGSERLLGEYTFNHSRSCPAQARGSQPCKVPCLVQRTTKSNSASTG